MSTILPAWDSEHTPGLHDSRGRPVPLKGVSVSAEIANPVALTRLTQTFRNEGRKPIEARYAFPAPLEAILTGLEIRVGERVLKGVVKAKESAEREYEDAIVKGDGAFLLTRLDDGLYQISVGNVLAGEEVQVTVQWAELLRWNGLELRYRLPNLVGPTYGDPQRAGIAPSDAPTHSAAASYGFALEVLLRGELAQARIASPDHALATQHTADGTHISLQRGATLNRAFTLTLGLEAPPALVAWRAPDGEASALLASLYLTPDSSVAKPRQLALLIDCSGSMEGVSIAQAREAVRRIIEAMNDTDTLALACFGDEMKLLTPTPVTVGKERDQLLTRCDHIRADMGGTEMQAALERTLDLCPEGSDLMLITDGQAHFSERDIRRLTQRGCRLFTIGVGHSTSEKVLRRLADESSGFCELVSPGEDMAGHIVSHFRRMHSPRAQVNTEWPGIPQRRHAPASVFAGDTALFTASLEGNAGATLCLQVESENGVKTIQCEVQPAEGQLAALLPRLVAWYQLPRDHVKQAMAEAVKYQLVTEHTSMVAVLTRDGLPEDVELPEVVDVPQMLPAAGVAMFCESPIVEFNSMRLTEKSFSADYDTPAYLRSSKKLPASGSLGSGVIPAFLRRSIDVEDMTPQDWLTALSALAAPNLTLPDLTGVPMPTAVIKALVEASGTEQDDLRREWQRLLLALALAVLGNVPSRELRKWRRLRQALEKLAETHAPMDDVMPQVQSRFDTLTLTDWGVEAP